MPSKGSKVCPLVVKGMQLVIMSSVRWLISVNLPNYFITPAIRIFHVCVLKGVAMIKLPEVEDPGCKKGNSQSPNAPLIQLHSTSLFFPFLFSMAGPRRSQPPSQLLAKQHGCSTNRSSSICPAAPPPSPPLSSPRAMTPFFPKWKQEQGRQVGAMLFRSVSGFLTVKDS